MKSASLVLSVLCAVACGDVDKPQEVNENEIITTVSLTFSPLSGGDPLSFAWADPENDGGPVVDDILLSDAEDYVLEVSFLNELADPPEDITGEVEAEGDQHQVFFTGSAVEGPATGDNPDAVISHTYGDEDENGLPLGLVNDISTLGAGVGGLTVTLRHLPPENDSPVKVEGLAEAAATGGMESLPGEADASVDFVVTVE
jgi:hypothetical protein